MGPGGYFLWHLINPAAIQGFAHQGEGAGGEDSNLPFCLSVLCFPEPSLAYFTEEFGLISFCAGSPEAI